MLKRATKQYHIDLEFRLVKKPRFGAHIERLLGTFLKEVHGRPGTTFSNPRQRGEYDSEGKAVMTLDEVEVWLSTFILGVYHARTHSETLTTPITCYEKGLLEGTETAPPTGLPRVISGDDELRLRLDFMPFFEATIQRSGVREDNITYSSDVLRRYVGAKEGKNARKFAFRRDLRDISLIYFYDPEAKRYYPIPCRNTAFPP